jgi:Cytochrome c oxidase assembly protein CtaG/Cox11
MKKFFLFFFTVVTLALPLFFWLTSAPHRQPRADEPIQVLSKYLKFLYARDFRRAYRFIATEDQRLKPVDAYARERESFSGFTLETAHKLSSLIQIRPVSEEPEGNRNHVTVAMRLPDANGLSDLLLDWDENRLNVLPAPEQKKILATIDRMIREKKVPMIEGKEDFTLVKEDSQWRVYLNWAAGVKVKFTALLPSGKTIAAEPITKETIARSGDVFTIGFRVQNRAPRDAVIRIVHRIEPKEFARYLDLVECALLLPVRLRVGEEETYNSTYMVRGDLPDGIKGLDVTYEFKIER